VAAYNIFLVIFFNDQDIFGKKNAIRAKSIFKTNRTVLVEVKNEVSVAQKRLSWWNKKIAKLVFSRKSSEAPTTTLQ
jgi:hypothetical protein